MRTGDGEPGHLIPEGLERLKQGKMDKDEKRRLVRHLLAGCPACREALGPLYALGEAPLEDCYDLPIRRAIAAVQETAEDLGAQRWRALSDYCAIVDGGRPAPRDRSKPPQGWWAWCEVLTEAVAQNRVEGTDARVEFAEIAVFLADEMPPGVYPPEALADLRARAWAELANALRAARDFEGAETALSEARGQLESGTGDPLLIARAFDVAGSLFIDLRRFDEALQSLDVAAELYYNHGEPHLAGRVLLNRGATLFYSGEAAKKAIEAFDAALSLLDPAQEPELVLIAMHNRLAALVDSGQADLAARALWRDRRLYKQFGSRTDQIRLLWLEANIAAAQDRPVQAEKLYRKARAGFQEAGLAFDAALVSLDLAALLLDNGQSDEVLELVEEMLRTFFQLRIRREALATIAVFHRAVAQGEATAVLARQLSKDLRRLLG
jgi:tetratricopeptide (TPR) repeat protein